jgi:hypothetical protein
MTSLEKMQHAIIESLKKEVGLLRKEIAGLREELAMFIDKDRPPWPPIKDEWV